MKNIFLKIANIILLIVGLSSKGNGQTVINYQTWTGASGCNIFASSTNVPATINGSAGTIVHLTAIGQPSYDNANGSVDLDCNIFNGSQNNGTEYRTTVNFKQGYAYTITINAARIMSTQQGGNALLRLDLNSGGSGGNIQCNGTGFIDASGSGNLKQSLQIGSNTFTDYVYNYAPLAAQQTYLMVAAIPPAGSVYQTILIRKITITETPPAASFSISSSTSSLACGATTPVTFTVNNVNNTPGITSYTWNIGATPNGWIYNGSPAPASIPITSTSLSPLVLTPDCGKALSSVSATVTANAVNYNTSNSSTVSISQPTYSITGASSLCSGNTNYTLNGLVCNSSIAWTPPSASLGSLSTLTASPTTLTYGGTSGNFTLTANVTSCGVTTPVTLPVHVGAYTSSDYTMSGGNSTTQPLYWCPNQTYGFSVSPNNSSNYVWTIPTGWTSTYNGGYVNSMRAPTGTNPPTGTVSVSFTEPCGTTITKSFFAAYSSSACTGTDPRFTYSPNPAPSYLYVAVASGYTSTTKIQRIQIVRSSTGLTIFDQNYGTPGVLSAYITTSSFQTGNHILRIYDGSIWASYQFVR